MGFFPEGMPLPAADRDTQPFWDACKEHRLVIQRCARCNAYRFAPSPVCADCNSFDWVWDQSEGKGEIYTYTIVHHPTHPATQTAVPYNAIVVQLRDCGQVKITSNLVDCANEDIKVGMPVEVTWEDVAEDVTLHRFRPIAK